jgi:hypothetical protein
MWCKLRLNQFFGQGNSRFGVAGFPGRYEVYGGRRLNLISRGYDPIFPFSVPVNLTLNTYRVFIAARTPGRLDLISYFFGKTSAVFKTSLSRVDRASNLGSRKIMKQDRKVCLSCRFSHFVAIVAVTVFGISASHVVAQDVAATYVNGAEVAVKSNGFAAEGKTLNITLQFAPSPGTQLMVVRNTGPGIIRGRFNNLEQGQTITLNYSGLTYHFVANYYGGNGNDLVLLWTTGDELVSPRAKAKLDGQLLLALRKNRGEPPFDGPTTLEPAIPVQDGDRVLVDIEGAVSKSLVDQVTLGGGAVPDSSSSSTTLRALVPLSRLETLASRPDVKSISPAKLSVTTRLEGQ